MSKAVEKKLWITSVQPREVDSNTSIPTSLCYLEAGGAALFSC